MSKVIAILLFALILSISFGKRIKLHKRKRQFLRSDLNVVKTVIPTSEAGMPFSGAILKSYTLYANQCFKTIIDGISYFLCYQSNNEIVVYKDSLTTGTASIVLSLPDYPTATGGSLTIGSTGKITMKNSGLNIYTKESDKNTCTKLILFPTFIAWINDTTNPVDYVKVADLSFS